MELKECKEIIKKFDEYKLSYEDEHSVVYTGKGEENKIELTLVRENVDYIFIQSPFVSTDEPESNLEVNVYIAGGKDLIYTFLKKCLWINRNPLEHEIYMTRCHLENLQSIKDWYQHAFAYYGFKQATTDIFGLGKKLFTGSCSDIGITFYNEVEDKIITLSTDFITGELLLEGQAIRELDFIEKFRKDEENGIREFNLEKYVQY